MRSAWPNRKFMCGKDLAYLPFLGPALFTGDAGLSRCESWYDRSGVAEWKRRNFVMTVRCERDPLAGKAMSLRSWERMNEMVSSNSTHRNGLDGCKARASGSRPS